MVAKAFGVVAFVFVVVMAAGSALYYSYTARESILPQIALIQGVQHYSATVQYPATGNLPKLPVKVTLSLDNGPDIVVVTTPEANDPNKYDITWDTRKVENGEHLVVVKAFWGQQMIGEESRKVDITN